MAESPVKVVITTEDKTSHGTKAAQDNFKKFSGTVNDTVTELTGFSVAQLSVAGTIATVANEVRKAIDEYSGYVESVDKVAMATGMQAEETSRLIQVADDFRVSQGALETAMKMALQNGYVPSIDALADLSDEYRSISDPAERAARMQEVFGRSWQDMVPLLEKGGTAIREAADGISDGLVVTQQAIEDNREYQAAVDNLNDSFTDLKYNLTREVIPALAAMIDAVNKSTEAQKNGIGRNEFIANQKALTAGAKAAEEWASSEREAAKAAQHAGDAVQDQTSSFKGFSKAIDDSEEYLQRWAKRQKEVDRLAKEHAETQQDLKKRVQETAAAYNRAGENAAEAFGDKAASAMEKYTSKGKKYEQWLEAVDKATGSNRLEAYKAEQSLDKLAVQFLQGKINAEELASELDSQEGTWATLDEDLKRAASGFKEANLMYDMFLTSLNESNGKHFQVSVDVAYGSGSGGGGTGGSQGQGGGGGVDTGGGPPRAQGGPVSRGTTYLVGENGPELFRPTQDGQIYSNKQSAMMGGGGGGININGPITVVAGDVRQMYRELAREAGKRQRAGYGYAGG